MNKALWKDNLREIKNSLPRFISILSIIMLGVAFFIGIRVSGPTMLRTAQKVYEENNMPDGYVLSTYGLNEEDLQEFESIDGVRWSAMQSVRANIDNGGESVKIYSYNGQEDENFFYLTQGRMPQSAYEIVLDSKFLEGPESEERTYQIGDQIILDYKNPEEGRGIQIINQELEIVGFARSPLYMERSRRGNDYNAFAVVHEDNLLGDVYSEAYYWVEEAADDLAYTEEYNSAIVDSIVAIEQVGQAREDIRYQQLDKELARKINDGKVSLKEGYEGLYSGQIALQASQDKLEEVRQEIEDAQMILAESIDSVGRAYDDLKNGMLEYQEGRLALLEGRQKLKDGQFLYDNGLSEYEAGRQVFDEEISSVRNRLKQGQQDIDAGYAQAQAGLQDLIAGQTAIESGYAQLEAGRQELLDQISLATTGEISAEELLTTLTDQIDTLNQFVALIENSEINDEQITNWIAALNAERQELLHAQQDLNESIEDVDVFIEDIPIASVLTPEEISKLEMLLNIDIAEDAYLDEVLTSLRQELERLNNLQTDLSQELENIDSETSQEEIKVIENQIAAYIEDIQTLEGQAQEIENRIANIQSQDFYQEEIQRLQNILAALQNTQEPEETSIQGEEISQAPTTAINLNIEEIRQQIETYQIALDEILQDEQALNNIITEIANNEALLAELRTQLADLEGLLDVDPDNPLLLEEFNNVRQQIIQLRDAINKLEAAQAELDRQSQNLNAGWADYYGALAELESAQRILNAGWAEFASQQSQGQAQLDAALDELTLAEEELALGFKDLDSGILALIQGNQKLNRGYLAYQSGLQELLKGQLDLIAGQEESLEGQLLLNQQVDNFTSRLPGNVSDLKQGQMALYGVQNLKNQLSPPTYYISQRNDISSYKSIENNAQQLNVISNIFPVFFILIAILVTYTTIRRMASEQRNYMGTMKQMGYPKSAIISKFIFYAGLAGIFGVIFGFLIGYLVFPKVIVSAYGIMYYFDDMQLVISHFWNILTAIVAMATVLIPAIWTPISILRAPAGHLLLPEPPKSGKKTLIEHVTFIWKHIGFYQKLTIRNLLRYKGRNLMTLIGVAGCTMLMLTGFGISDTINGLSTSQFNDIQRYDAMVVLQESIDKDVSILDEYEAIQGVGGSLPIYQEVIDVESPQGGSHQVTLIVPMGPPEQVADFIQIRPRGQETVDLNQSGPMITERLAELLQYHGQEINFVDEDYERYQIDQVGVVENYAQHYLYLSEADYEEIFQESPQANTVLLLYEEESQSADIEETLTHREEVISLVDIRSIANNVQEAMGSLDLITVVLIIAAAALSFVVLYNLTNINVSERIRELSTIKVLGFYDIEVTRYIFNEVNVLTLLGSLLGLVFGYFLTHYIMKTMQTNELLFYPVIETSSYLYSLVLSFIFSAIVMLAMHFKLKKIDMVEALKAVD